MQNFIQFQAWAETNVNFLYRVRAPFASTLVISSTIVAKTFKPCILFLLSILTQDAHWPTDLDLYFIHINGVPTALSAPPPPQQVWHHLRRNSCFFYLMSSSVGNTIQTPLFYILFSSCNVDMFKNKSQLTFFAVFVSVLLKLRSVTALQFNAFCIFLHEHRILVFIFYIVSCSKWVNLPVWLLVVEPYN